MPIVRPFTGLLYDPNVVGPIETVTAPPYDTISPIDQQRYHRASPHNVIRLILGRGRHGDGEESNKYTRAASFLRVWRESGVLKPTPRPSVFPYELRFHLGGRERRIRGVILEVDIEPWGGWILPHEGTLPGPIEDRLRLLRAVGANLSPVYGIVGGPCPELGAFLDRAVSEPPRFEVPDDAGTEHRLWLVPEDQAGAGLDGLAAALRAQSMMIADGHHRYTVALAHRQEMRAAHGPGPWDAMMMLVVDGATEEPPVLPIHRVVLGGRPDEQEQDGRRVRDMAEVLASLEDDRLTYGVIRLEDGEVIHRIATLAGAPPTVRALHDQVLDRLDGARLRFVPDAVVAEEAVRTGSARAAYLLPPTRVERVRSLIEGGGRLPLKSTYFWPKPRTGLVIRPFDP
jgi:uncharacterized protein (DUF1015 family)